MECTVELETRMKNEACYDNGKVRFEELRNVLRTVLERGNGISEQSMLGKNFSTDSFG